MKRFVLFDIDGTLVDSNDAHARAWERAFGAHGRTVSASAVRPLIGMGGDRVIATVTPDLSADEGTGKAITETRLAAFLGEEIATVRPFPGVRELVEALRSRGFTCGVATSAQDAERDALLKLAGVSDLLTEGSTSADADASKPAPDIVEAALAKLGADPARTALVGDTKYDVEAAHRAGVRAIALRCGGADSADLAEADAVYDDPAALMRALDRVPFG
jgi:HAD superfamily hydrolase (TIGR01509 family)